ncbi:MAG: AmmeMemoRadiSam system radical SAM enzyme [Verrucomicrobiota bacterium]|nr:AmmeMemoRadiSam system radical SAM enzyme [Verrucomicrobiota bacterium]
MNKPEKETQIETQKSRVADNSLAALLDRHTREGILWTAEADGRVRCLACGHRCWLAPGQRGICKIRFNDQGKLRVPFGYVAGAACDPIEKKPFFHVQPGSAALTFGMLGCNFHCAFCQNWISSQALRDKASGGNIEVVRPDQLIDAAERCGASSVVSSYNEPFITAEWAGAVFELATKSGLLCAMVSNGYGTPELLKYLSPWLKALKIDLKCFNDQRYRFLGGTLAVVMDTIRRAHGMGLWVEIVTLLVPGLNDDPQELRDLTQFIASVSPDIPWHVTAFHPDYRMTDARPTRASDLLRAVEIGAGSGLRFVYAGNLPGNTGQWENTRCHGCGETVIERTGFTVHANRLGPDGKCPRCGRIIPGIWR